MVCLIFHVVCTICLLNWENWLQSCHDSSVLVQLLCCVTDASFIIS